MVKRLKSIVAIIAMVILGSIAFITLAEDNEFVKDDEALIKVVYTRPVNQQRVNSLKGENIAVYNFYLISRTSNYSAKARDYSVPFKEGTLTTTKTFNSILLAHDKHWEWRKLITPLIDSYDSLYNIKLLNDYGILIVNWDHVTHVERDEYEAWYRIAQDVTQSEKVGIKYPDLKSPEDIAAAYMASEQHINQWWLEKVKELYAKADEGEAGETVEALPTEDHSEP